MKRKIDNFTVEEIAIIVKNSSSFKEVALALGYKNSGAGSGAVSSMLKEYFDNYQISYEHFVGKGWAKKEYTGSNPVKTNYLRTHEHKCAYCGIGEEWNGKFLVLQLHHIDGNHNNNAEENLCLVCPNCHSQTENFTGRNKKIFNQPSKVSDEVLLEMVQECNGNIRQALLKLNLSTGGQNYLRVKRLLEQKS